MAPQAPYGQTGNNVVTGNVGGNRHFRGVVPYGSSYYNNSSVSSGTSSVQRFMRRSANPVVSDRNPGQSRAYYQPERTVSSMTRNGNSGLSRPTVQSQGRPVSTPLPTTQTSTSQYRPRPLSNNDLEMQKMVSQQVMLETAAKVNLEKNQTTQTQKSIFDQTLKPQDIEEIKEKQAESEQAKAQRTPEEEVLFQLQKLQAQQIQKEKEADAKTDQESKSPTDLLKSDEEKTDQPEQTLPAEVEQAILRAEGRKALGKHETFNSLADEKYTQYLLAAEQYFKDGQFYKATDAYELAATWIPNDPRAYLGRSFALFAAGEYMSSAFYLSEATRMSPELVAQKYDLPKLIGSRDTYENRLVEMATWQQRSKSPELAFLTAYALYQDGKFQRAAASIAQALEQMPDDQSVQTLNQLIQSKANGK
jgi:hypothetical protein